MRLQKLLSALIAVDNTAADDLLLEALRVGNEDEQMLLLDALIQRKTPGGLGGVLAQFDALPARCQGRVKADVRVFYHALSQAGRSNDKAARFAAMRIIALTRQGKLGYVLSENLREPDDALSKAAAEALLEMSRWVNRECRLMHRFHASPGDDLALVGEASHREGSTVAAAVTTHGELEAAYETVMEQRPEIEAAVARALDWARTKHLGDLMRAALLLCDHPQSRTLAILKTTRHGGQASMVRKLQQPPAADSVEAFLLGASHGQLRTNFAAAFAQITDRAVLDSLLRRTYWLADHQLSLCLSTVSRGVWWDPVALPGDLDRREPAEAAAVADWIVASGLDPAQQDGQLLTLLERAKEDVGARLRVLLAATRQPKGSPCGATKVALGDTDERLARIAARELIRRRPADFESALLKQMTTGAPSVRRIIGRAIGQVGFDQYWNRFERMDRTARIAAGRAMMKLLPDAADRLGRYLSTGNIDQRVRALAVIQDLQLVERFRDLLVQTCMHPNAKVRSKAVSLLISLPNEPVGAILEKALVDTDPRVRANAVEVVDVQQSPQFVPMLAERARTGHNRERANAIKALHGMKIDGATHHLQLMLGDPRAEHRISALWALKQVGLWALLNHVGAIAQRDDNLRVRRYAVAMLKSVIEQVNAANQAKVA